MLTPELTREQLKKWRRTELFYCPQCKSPLQLKVGEIMIPHFAHKKDTSCSACFSEGETQEHLQGKLQLYHFLQKQTKHVELEPFLRMLSQRPDLLVTTTSASTPIEFQCSTIPVSDMESRSNGYRSIGMKPIWILHTPAKFTTLPQAVGMFYFSKFHESFLTHTYPEAYTFLTYNPQKERFHYFSSLIHVAGKRYIGIHRSLPLSKQVFPFAKPKAPSKEELHQYVAIYVSMRNDFLQSRILLNRRGVNDSFLKICYEMRVHPTNLPLWIGIPVTFSESFREHDCEWQLGLIHFMKWRGIRFSDLTENQIRGYLSSIEGVSIGRLQACVAYRDLLIAEGIESFQNSSVINDKMIFRVLSERLLAKRYEN
ncbi:competence protein CoiA [Sporosarcina sp. FSL K6-3457]|uniref:competence protein CoiA n=1 Tax=Sporosarcina sp. FSL K6-3457 TaxID=2978204 RepID=UPI004046F624